MQHQSSTSRTGAAVRAGGGARVLAFDCLSAACGSDEGTDCHSTESDSREPTTYNDPQVAPPSAIIVGIIDHHFPQHPRPPRRPRRQRTTNATAITTTITTAATTTSVATGATGSAHIAAITTPINSSITTDRTGQPCHYQHRQPKHHQHHLLQHQQKTCIRGIIIIIIIIVIIIIVAIILVVIIIVVIIIIIIKWSSYVPRRRR